MRQGKRQGCGRETGTSEDVAKRKIEAARDAAKDAAGDVAWGDLWMAISGVGWIWDVMWPTARKDVMMILKDATADGVKKGGTIQETVHSVCRFAIINRKKIYEAIDKAAEKTTAVPMTVKKATEVCEETVITFDEEQFAKLRLTIPLKMVDYLLGYEQIISFLRPYEQYHLLMEQHRKLVQRLGLEKIYLKLTSPREIVGLLAECLPLFPLVLLEIVVGYCQPCMDVPDDVDEIYQRLLSLEEFQSR